ncbi:hypothetical protein [Microbacterium rhizosphaerae]|uniref:Uncharacterized protein n=1 Tax=Microbacterium rhizosphaerae TaxID=1678237 RepID=A0ABZ0STZ2_9MICO|nr:hypothetical protein [Microbacterium rhizosphaerae]WPR91323.1 hypothetical protein SM116_08620 [Microbacterium rhizosphaerae]
MAGALAVAGLTGCTQSTPAAKPGVLVAHVKGQDKTVAVTAPKLDDTSIADLKSITDLGPVAVGVPVHLGVDGGLPKAGATISKTYAKPLPNGAAATFIWWDPTAGAWEAVPSELSKDRRVLTAHVEHFSIWDDLVAGSAGAISAVTSAAKSAGQSVSNVIKIVGQGVSAANKAISNAVQSGADALFYGAGEVLSTRADAPQCTGGNPDWVESAVFIQDYQTNPLRFCVGSDSAGNVVVKAAANRAYAFPYTLAVAPVSEEGEALGFKKALDSAVDLDKDIANSVATLTNGGRLILPGETASFTFSQDAIAALKDPAVLSASEPNLVTWLMAELTSMLVKYGISLDTSYVSAVLKLATCARDYMDVKDLGSLAKVASSCADASIGQDVLTNYLKLQGAAGSALDAAKKVMDKIGICLIFISAGFDAVTYGTDSQLPSSARTVNITAKPFPAYGHWVIDSTGIGPIKLNKTSYSQFSSFLAKTWQQPMCGQITAYAAAGVPKGGASGWEVYGTGVKDGPYTELDLITFDTSKVVNAPRTASGITLGTKESVLAGMGLTSTPTVLEPGMQYSWTENGTPMLAVAHNGVVDIIAVNLALWYGDC